MLRNLIDGDFGNIAGDRAVVRIVGVISKLCIFVPFRREYAAAAYAVKSPA